MLIREGLIPGDWKPDMILDQIWEKAERWKRRGLSPRGRTAHTVPDGLGSQTVKETDTQSFPPS